MMNTKIPDSTRSIERAILILNELSRARGELGILEISQNLGINQSTVYRIVSTFKKYGYIEQNAGSSKYRLGASLLPLSKGYLQSFPIRETIHEILTQFRDRCRETVHYAVRSGNEIIYLEKIQGLHPIGIVATNFGDRAPLHCTAMGKVFLAYSPQAIIEDLLKNYRLEKKTPSTIIEKDELLRELEGVRKKGYAINREELEIGVGAVAVPIFDSTGLIGAISATGPANRIYELTSTMDLVNQIIETGNEISSRLGGGHYFQDRSQVSKIT